MRKVMGRLLLYLDCILRKVLKRWSTAGKHKAKELFL